MLQRLFSRMVNKVIGDRFVDLDIEVAELRTLASDAAHQAEYAEAECDRLESELAELQGEVEDLVRQIEAQAE